MRQAFTLGWLSDGQNDPVKCFPCGKVRMTDDYFADATADGFEKQKGLPSAHAVLGKWGKGRGKSRGEV